MLVEAIAAAVVCSAVLWLVLQPLFGSRHTVAQPAEPLDPEETPRGVALAALKEIDFDRETGKLSEGDYQFLKAKYTGLALEALRAEDEARSSDMVEALIAARTRVLASGSELGCRTCGPRPEPDAVYCSACGVRLASSPVADAAAQVPPTEAGPLVIRPPATARFGGTSGPIPRPPPDPASY
jgi:hypothetical protein